MAFVLGSFMYLLFWFTLVWFVTSLNRSSSQNALILISSWIVLTIIIPAAVNNTVVNLYQIPEAYETTIDSREGYHSKWDQAKAPTIQQFKQYYPQYSEFEHPQGQSFSWFWYYAMQHMGDIEAADAVNVTYEKLNKRDRFIKLIGLVVPSIHTQLGLNAMSRSDMTNYLKYIRALEKFHEGKRLNFYPMIFQNKPISEENWDQYQLEYYKDDRNLNWMYLFLPLMIWIVILLIFSRRYYGRLSMI